MDNLEQSIKFAKKVLTIEKNNEWSINHLIKLYKSINDWANATEFLKMLFVI